MILLFKNQDKNTYFFVDPTKGTASHVTYREVDVFFRYKDFLQLQILSLPDYKTVQQFQCIVKKSELKNIPINELKTHLLNNYPEYFI